MNDMLDPNKMAEATRLTRAGRLAEATALLQRMLRRELPPDMQVGIAGDIVPAGGQPLIIDATESEETDPSSRVGIGSRSTGRPLASAFTTARRHLLPKLSALLRAGRSGTGLGLHGLMQPAPASTPDAVSNQSIFRCRYRSPTAVLGS
jgi:pentatricopeptide repeat protein